MFSEAYAYFSSASTSWLDHAQRFFLEVTESLELNEESFVLEVASNDGYFLRHFVSAGIPCLGIEPTKSTALAAKNLGIEVLEQFFGELVAREIAHQHGKADLIVCNNVFAHVPDIGDFSRGLATALGPEGTISLEFPHLMNLIRLSQFDTVYHEHYSYLSLTAVTDVVQRAGLRVYDVERITTHGGSLRVYLCHEDAEIQEKTAVQELLREELQDGVAQLNTYLDFQDKISGVADKFRTFLTQAKIEGKTVAAYGAAAKGNTLLNFMEIGPELVCEVYDSSPSKQGLYLPGSHIPIFEVTRIQTTRPDYIVILPWNIASEIRLQMGDVVSTWGGKFLVAIPELEIFS